MSFDPPRFIRRNKEEKMDLIDREDTRFNKEVKDGCEKLQLTLELRPDQRGILKDFLAADMESSGAVGQER